MQNRLTKWVNDRYGGKRPFLYYLYNKLLGRLGRFDTAEQINWSNVERLVFVCRGNICRSPYAEIIAKKSGFETASLGLITRTGKHANIDAIRNASFRGVDLSEHMATDIKDFKFNRNDLLIAMEPWQLDETRRQVKEADVYHTLLGIWAEDYYPYLPDPYGKSDVFFQRCFLMIESAMDQLASKCHQASK